MSVDIRDTAFWEIIEHDWATKEKLKATLKISLSTYPNTSSWNKLSFLKIWLLPSIVPMHQKDYYVRESKIRSPFRTIYISPILWLSGTGVKPTLNYMLSQILLNVFHQNLWKWISCSNRNLHMCYVMHYISDMSVFCLSYSK